MNYGDVKTQIRDLGFEEDSTMTEYASIVRNAINTAIASINMSVAPIKAYITVDQDGTDSEFQFYNMSSLTGGKFLEFTASPVEIGDGEKYTPFNDFDIENDNTVVINGETSGTFRIYYHADHTQYTADTADSVELPLPVMAHRLVPLLASYYVWLDDDQTKAITYYNQYEALASQIMAKQEKPRMTVRTDWGGGYAI